MALENLAAAFAIIFFMIYGAVAAVIVFLVTGLRRRPRATVMGTVSALLFAFVASRIAIPFVANDTAPFLGFLLFLGLGYGLGVVAFPDDAFGVFRGRAYTVFTQLVSVAGIVVSLFLVHAAISAGLPGVLAEQALSHSLEILLVSLFFTMSGILGVLGLLETRTPHARG